MRRQDEILLLYPGQAPLARKFLLSQVEEMAGAFDSEELLEFLIGQLADEDGAVRGQALCSLARFLPGYVRKRYAIQGVAAGMWTAYGDGQPGSLTREGIERATRAPMVSKAALTATWPLVQQVLAQLPGLEGWARTRSVLALGRYAVKPGLEWLAKAAGGAPPELPAALALAQMGREETHAELLGAVRKFGPQEPDLYLVLADTPGAEAFSIVMDAIPRTNMAGRMNLARVLSHFTLDQAATALKELWQRAEGWVGAAALASLESIGLPQAAPVVSGLFRSAPHRFLKLQAVKAAGGLRAEESVSFCRDALHDPDQALCAVALESLVRLGLPREELRKVALPFLESQHVKARTNAILAAVPAADVLGTASFRDLLLSGEAVSRLEAAYVLGYLRSKRALELLATLAAQDPSPPVRIQAIKSLSRYPASESVPLLVALFASDEAKVVLATARVLGRYDGDESALVAESLEEALDGKPRPAVRAVMLKALGMAIRRAKLPHGRNVLASALADPEISVRAGAVEGWVMAGAAGSDSVLAKLREIAEGSDPRVRCRALLALWNAGDVNAPEVLARLAGKGGDQVAPAMDSALEIGLLLGDVAVGNGFPELTQTLQTTKPAGPEPEILPYRSAPSANAGRVAEGPEPPQEENPSLLATNAPPTRHPSSSPGVAPRARAPSSADVTLPPGHEPAAATPATATPAGTENPRSRMAPSSRVRPPSSRVRAPGDKSRDVIGADQLKEFLTSATLKRQGVADVQRDLEGVSYVVGGAQGPVARMRELLAEPKAKLALLVPVVLVLLFGFFALSSGGDDLEEAPLPAGARAHLWVNWASGPCKVGDTALKEQDPIKPGAAIQTGPFADLVLETPVSCRAVMKSESRLTFDGVMKRRGGPMVYRFHGADGDVTFEFESGAELELRFDRVKIRSRGVKLQVGSKPDRGTITILEGEARIESPDRQATLKTGSRIRIQQ